MAPKAEAFENHCALFTQSRGAYRLIALKTAGLFVATALAEIVGCWLVLVWRKQAGSSWLLVPAAVALALFAWLLTLHPVASGRVYAAYGGVYVATALAWLMWVDRVPLDRYDALGGLLIFSGAAVIIVAHWNSGG
jgi:small multidrug resistance family-3 protein